jgi:hypothetical protein
MTSADEFAESEVRRIKAYWKNAAGNLEMEEETLTGYLKIAYLIGQLHLTQRAHDAEMIRLRLKGKATDGV